MQSLEKLGWWSSDQFGCVWSEVSCFGMNLVFRYCKPTIHLELKVSVCLWGFGYDLGTIHLTCGFDFIRKVWWTWMIKWPCSTSVDLRFDWFWDETLVVQTSAEFGLERWFLYAFSRGFWVWKFWLEVFLRVSVGVGGQLSTGIMGECY